MAAALVPIGLRIPIAAEILTDVDDSTVVEAAPFSGGSSIAWFCRLRNIVGCIHRDAWSRDALSRQLHECKVRK